jgi:AcrR family transcriptional regulator
MKVAPPKPAARTRRAASKPALKAPRGKSRASAEAGAKAKPAYHHGDLRRALLDAALSLVSEHGIAALTLREVARRVGVTHAAPYHHFATRDTLLDALAHEGFMALDVACARAASGVSEPTERLFAVGQTYVDYARAHPEQLQIMFRRQPGAAVDPEHQATRLRAYGHLHDAVVACQAISAAPPGDPYQVALAAWSLVHGFAKLWVEGPISSMPHYAPHYEALRDSTLRTLMAAWNPNSKVPAR